jgi:hypothetical protein
LEKIGKCARAALTKKALSEPHKIYIDPTNREEGRAKTLKLALKEMMRKEPLGDMETQQTV